jgi:DUF1365 family protein
MNTLDSCLYIGKVWHRRLRPKQHRLNYRVYSLLCDLDELPTLSLRLRLFSHNRFNLFSVHDRDFGAGDGTALRPWIESQLASAGIQSENIRISLLCYPRLLGYSFNPLSVFFCRRPGDCALVAIFYEVHNTFGERHCYLIPADPTAAVIDQTCEKEFYVSPFIGMAASYRFRVLPPSPIGDNGNQLSIVINESDAEGPLLDAAFHAKRVLLSDAKLLTLLATHPLMTLKVIAGIHWEALKLWLKGVKLVDRPPPPRRLVTIVPGEAAIAEAGDQQLRSNA